MYIHELPDWPKFFWDKDKIADILSEVTFRQGSVLGKMQALGFDVGQKVMLSTLTDEITKSGENGIPKSLGYKSPRDYRRDLGLVG